MLQKTCRERTDPVTVGALVLSLLLAVVLVAISWAGFRQRQLASQVVRFHVVANSDGEEDQRVKLIVRDAVEVEVEELLQGADSPAEVQQRLSARLQSLAQAGADALQEAGGSGPVTAQLGQMFYPTKESGALALPAGQYTSLQISIGAGEGHNWWCILFPDLTVPEQEPESQAQTAMAEGLSQDDVNLMARSEVGYELRFRCIEWWEELQAWLSR